jgi:riboflavin synthase
MFTGIIEELGTITQHTRGLLVVRAPKISAEAALGDSVATNGICLTVTRLATDTFTAEYSDTTRSVTTIEQWKVGGHLNLEQALTLNTRLGGHLVSGHIDGVGKIRRIRDHGAQGVFLDVWIPTALQRYVLQKGSIAIDGVSLTVVACHADTVELTIVPHTWNHTCLVDRKVGDAVNVEVDMLGKYVERLLQAGRAPAGALTWAELAQQGYGS